MLSLYGVSSEDMGLWEWVFYHYIFMQIYKNMNENPTILHSEQQNSKRNTMEMICVSKD